MVDLSEPDAACIGRISGRKKIAKEGEGEGDNEGGGRESSAYAIGRPGTSRYVRSMIK